MVPSVPPIQASRIARLHGLSCPQFAALPIIRKKKNVKNIFVGNLSFGATEQAVRSLFEPYGAVDRVNVVTDRDTGRAKGFGFVEMSVADEADRAIAGLNGRELDGRALTVNEARPKEERGGGGFRSNSGRQQKRW
jgi:RNA recognition motif-containing protein